MPKLTPDTLETLYADIKSDNTLAEDRLQLAIDHKDELAELLFQESETEKYTDGLELLKKATAKDDQEIPSTNLSRVFLAKRTHITKGSGIAKSIFEEIALREKARDAIRLFDELLAATPESYDDTQITAAAQHKELLYQVLMERAETDRLGAGLTLLENAISIDHKTGESNTVLSKVFSVRRGMLGTITTVNKIATEYWTRKAEILDEEEPQFARTIIKQETYQETYKAIKTLLDKATHATHPFSLFLNSALAIMSAPIEKEVNRELFQFYCRYQCFKAEAKALYEELKNPKIPGTEYKPTDYIIQRARQLSDQYELRVMRFMLDRISKEIEKIPDDKEALTLLQEIQGKLQTPTNLSKLYAGEKSVENDLLLCEYNIHARQLFNELRHTTDNLIQVKSATIPAHPIFLLPLKDKDNNRHINAIRDALLYHLGMASSKNRYTDGLDLLKSSISTDPGTQAPNTPLSVLFHHLAEQYHPALNPVNWIRNSIRCTEEEPEYIQDVVYSKLRDDTENTLLNDSIIKIAGLRKELLFEKLKEELEKKKDDLDGSIRLLERATNPRTSLGSALNYSRGAFFMAGPGIGHQLQKMLQEKRAEEATARRALSSVI